MVMRGEVYWQTNRIIATDQRRYDQRTSNSFQKAGSVLSKRRSSMFMPWSFYATIYMRFRF